MIRWRFTQVATESQETYRVEIDDPTWSGSVTDVTGVGFSFQHQSISDTDPFSSNILEGQLSVTLYVSTSDSNMMTRSFLDTLVQGEDDDYSLILKIKNGGIYDTLWTGSVLPDLTSFDESFEPYTATIVAKDFVLTKIQDYTPDDSRRRLIDIIKEIVQEEVNTTVKSFTAFKSKDINDDYLSYVYIDDSSLKDYPSGSITKFEALQWILQSNNLILWQWDNEWFLSQLSAYGDSTGYVYDSSTDATTLEITRRSLTDITIDSVNTVVPAVGLALGEYKHRTRISLLNDPLPSYVQVVNTNSTGITYQGKFDADANSHTVELSFDIEVSPGISTISSMNVAVEIGYGDYRWLEYSTNVVSPPADQEWVDIADITGGVGNRRNIVELSNTGQFGQKWSGSFAISTDNLPQGNNETFFITFYRATDNASNNYTANYTNVDFAINDANADNNSESIDFLASTSKAYSYRYNMADVYFGDAVVEYQRSKYLQDDGAGGLQNTSLWQYRGETRDKSFIELLSEDVLNFMNKAKRLLNATVKIPSTSTPLNVNLSVLYDSITWAYLGGSLDSTGNWNVKFIEVGYVDNINTVAQTPIYGDNPRDLNNQGLLLPERNIDRSGVTTFTTQAQQFLIPGNQDTTAVNVELLGQDAYSLEGFNITSPRVGQEIIVWIDVDEVLTIKVGSQGGLIQPILTPNGTDIIRRSLNSVFRFKYVTINSQNWWLLLYESALPVDEEPVEPVDKVATPVFAPSPGTFTQPTNLTILCATPGATIKYNTDGSETYSTYTGAISLSVGSSYTVKAYAEKTDFQDSNLIIGEYNIVPQVSPPTISPGSGSYETSATVTISSSDTVYYTTDGSDPDNTDTLYTGAITITTNTTLKAIAYRTISGTDYTSAISTAVYVITATPEDPVVATPTFSPVSGAYNEPQNVQILCSTNLATIYYTTDGSTPTTGSSIYFNPIAVSEDTTIKAFATKLSHQDSAVATAFFTIAEDSEADIPNIPTFSPANPYFENSVDVTIQTSGESGRAQTVYYTTDGSDPTTGSSTGTSVTLTSTTTIKARAKYNDGTELSPVATKTYSQNFSVIYTQGWNLISHPFRHPLTEPVMRDIFGLKRNTAVNFIGTYNPLYNVEYNPNDTIYKAEPGRGHWAYIDEDINVNFGNYGNTRLNLLSNNTTVPTAETTTSIPYTWSIESGTVGITGFRSTVNEQQYARIQFIPATSTYSKKLYLDDIVTRNYQSGNYELTLKMSAINDDNATIYLGVEEYDSTKTSVTTTETSISPTGTPATFTETLSIGSSEYVRPYIKVVETSAPTNPLTLYIRELEFSADPGFITGPITYDTSSGWVLAGALAQQSTITTDGTIATDGIIGFRNGTYSTAFEDDLRPGRGYFAYITGATEFTIDES